MIRSRVTRRAITLVEMMVAMALTLGIMLLLTESFKMALDFIRGQNSTGTMVAQLNGAGILLGRDLKAGHFLPEGPQAMLSNQRLDLYASPNSGWTQPTGGFFRIESPNPGTGTQDANGFYLNPASANHKLHFTSILRGGADQDLFTVLSPAQNGSPYKSKAAEVAYFLVQTGNTGGPVPQNLYNLYRRSRLMALTVDEAGVLQPAVNDTEVISSYQPSGGPPAPARQVNTMATVMNRANRMALTPLTGNRLGEDIVLSNVLFFEVLADWTPGTNSPNGPRNFTTNTDYPYDFLTQNNNNFGIFDTWNMPPNVPLTNPVPEKPQAVRIKSLQITIRVFDPKLKGARQNTWKFAM